MEIIAYLIDLFVNLDEHLSLVITRYGTWTYLILFLVIFMETGFVVTPFLPGDSLLFAAGTFAALGALDVTLVFLLLFAAAVLGDTANYWIGRRIGPAGVEETTRGVEGGRRTAKRRSSWPVSFPSSAPSHPSWRVSEKCPTAASWPTTLSAAWFGRRVSRFSVTSSGTSRS